MHAKNNALSLILQKIWVQLKFLWQTDGRTDGQMSFNVPHFREKAGDRKAGDNNCIVFINLGGVTYLDLGLNDLQA